MNTAWAYFYVAAGGALGSVLRFWVANAVARRFGEALPWGTIAVNVSGSFLIGLIAGCAHPGSRFANESFRQFFVAGLCGGYTTFSAFSLQTFDLARTGNWLAAGGNVFVSVALCLVGVWLGHLIGAALGSR